jgi:plasmid maintenance system antidote protein VapI
LIDQLKEAIRQSEYTLAGLEQAAGLPRGQLSRFVRGERTLTLPVAERICRVLGLKLTAEGDQGTGSKI